MSNDSLSKNGSKIEDSPKTASFPSSKTSLSVFLCPSKNVTTLSHESPSISAGKKSEFHKFHQILNPRKKDSLGAATVQLFSVKITSFVRRKLASLISVNSAWMQLKGSPNGGCVTLKRTPRLSTDGIFVVVLMPCEASSKSPLLLQRRSVINAGMRTGCAWPFSVGKIFLENFF